MDKLNICNYRLTSEMFETINCERLTIIELHHLNGCTRSPVEKN